MSALTDMDVIMWNWPEGSPLPDWFNCASMQRPRKNKKVPEDIKTSSTEKNLINWCPTDVKLYYWHKDYSTTRIILQGQFLLPAVFNHDSFGHFQHCAYFISPTAVFRISIPLNLGFSQSEITSLGRITGIRLWMKAMDSTGSLVRTENTGLPCCIL